MSAELGALSSYALSVQQMQMNLIKTNMQMEEALVDLLTDAARSVPASDTLGQNIDISI